MLGTIGEEDGLNDEEDVNFAREKRLDELGKVGDSEADTEEEDRRLPLANRFRLANGFESAVFKAGMATMVGVIPRVIVAALEVSPVFFFGV